MAKAFYEIKASADGSAEILIYDEIGAGWFTEGQTAKQFATDLKALGKITALTIRINSPGGDVFEGQAIYSQLKSHKARKTVVIDGLAASIASLIAMAGDELLMPENAMLMIHDPAGLALGTADDMRKSAEMLDKIKSSMVSVYAKKSGLDREEIAAIMNEETWFTAQDAVDQGFADRVTDAVPLAATFDLSKFRKVPEPLRLVALATTKPTNLDKSREKETPMEPKITAEPDKPNPTPEPKPEPQTPSPDAKAAFADGEKAERERVTAILNAQLCDDHGTPLPGQGRIAAECIKLGVTAKEAAEHFKKLRLNELTAVAPLSAGGGSDPKPVPDLSQLPDEDRWKAEWDRTPAIRAEFSNAYGPYAAYKRAEAAGQVQILMKTPEKSA
jgi:ATP-dependent Clp protease protease subunit